MSEDTPPPIPPGPPLLPVQRALDPATGDPNTAMLAHLLGILTGFLGPLIIWLVKRDDSQFVDYHGKEALNFQLFYLLVSLGLVVISIVTFGVAIVVTVPALFVIAILFLVWEIQGCIAASRGEYYRYPMSIRFIA